MSYTSLESLDSEEEEGEKAINQLVLNKNQNQLIPVIELKAPILLISISSLNNEHTDDLIYALPRAMGEVEVVHYFREAYDFNGSSGKANMVKFKNLS